jgi:hypothetical protein
MKKSPQIKTKRKAQTDEGLATGLLNLGRDIAGGGKPNATSRYKEQKQEFIDVFKARWKDWWNRRKGIEVPKETEPAEKETTPVAESKRFLNPSILSESEYNRLNYLFENIVHLEEVSDTDAQQKAMIMNSFLQQVYPTIWKEIQSPRNKATYESELMKWANSGFFSIGALDHFIELLYPLAQQGVGVQAEKTPAEDRPATDSYARFSRDEVDAAIKAANDKFTKLAAVDSSSEDSKRQELILNALMLYKNSMKS